MRKIGPYLLEKRIGQGGNGSVFRACGPDGSVVALKVLRSDRGNRDEPRKRFESEIALLTQLRGSPGVMPILESGTENGRPWFTMPLAIPLREALKSASLSEIVEAFAQFARTLAKLGDQGIYHRDVKPENLFCLPAKNWVIGDFGIHKAPQNPVLTKDGRRIGPALYCAQEMLDYHHDQDHSRADVFSLAKSFWVIATRQQLPLQGQHPEGFRGAWLDNYRTEANTAPLDRLLVRATALISEQRLTMHEFDRELSAWLSPAPTSATSTDLSDVGPLLVDPYRRANSDLLQQSERRKKMSDVVQLAAASLSIVEQSLRTLGSGAIVNGASISNSREMLAALGQGIQLSHPGDYSSTYVSLLSAGGAPPYLHSGMIVVLTSKSSLTIRAGHVLILGRPYPSMATPLFQVTETVDLDSLLVPATLSKLSQSLLPSLKDAVLKFAEAMKGSAEQL